jgi:hypothetical protein
MDKLYYPPSSGMKGVIQYALMLALLLLSFINASLNITIIDSTNQNIPFLDNIKLGIMESIQTGEGRIPPIKPFN